MKLDPPWLDVRATGKPITQGSMKAIQPKNQPRPIVVVENSAALRKWRKAVGDAVRAARAGAELTGPVGGAVWVRLDFVLRRPASHKRDSEPIAKVGDVDKLARAVLDGLTGVAFIDDGQVVHLTATKRYADTTDGVRIRVGRVTGP